MREPSRQSHLCVELVRAPTRVTEDHEHLAGSVASRKALEHTRVPRHADIGADRELTVELNARNAAVDEPPTERLDWTTHAGVAVEDAPCRQLADARDVRRVEHAAQRPERPAVDDPTYRALGLVQPEQHDRV